MTPDSLAAKARDPRKPGCEEASIAFFLASYAKEVVTQIIETGHPEATAFINLCGKIDELEGCMFGPVDYECEDQFFARAEELNTLAMEGRDAIAD